MKAKFDLQKTVIIFMVDLTNQLTAMVNNSKAYTNTKLSWLT